MAEVISLGQAHDALFLKNQIRLLFQNCGSPSFFMLPAANDFCQSVLSFEQMRHSLFPEFEAQYRRLLVDMQKFLDVCIAQFSVLVHSGTTVSCASAIVLDRLFSSSGFAIFWFLEFKEFEMSLDLKS